VSRTTRFAFAVLALVTAVLSVAAPATAAPGGVVRTANRSPVPHPHRAPWPVTITIQTVPPLADVHFTFDGADLTTDASGRTSYTDDHNFNSHSIALVDTAIDLPDRHYRFARWAGQRDPGQAFRPAVGGLPMRANYTVTAAFTVQYPVSARFMDEKGRPIDLDRILAVKVKSDSGQLVDFPKNGTIWLDGTLPTYRKSELVESDVTYSLQSVMMGGTNIVDAGRQRFSPAKSSTVTFTGQFFDLTVRAHDAMFRNNVGSHAKVAYPDGKVRSIPLGPDGTAVLAGLPRGQYTVTIAGGGGVVLAEQFNLSKDKDLDLAVVSYLDAGSIALVVLLIAAGLLLVGRARLRRYLRLLLNRIHARAGAAVRPLHLRELAVAIAARIPAPRTGTADADAAPEPSGSASPAEPATPVSAVELALSAEPVVSPDPVPVAGPVVEPAPVTVAEPEPAKLAMPDPVMVAEPEPVTLAMPDPAVVPHEPEPPVEATPSTVDTVVLVVGPESAAPHQAPSVVAGSGALQRTPSA